MPLLHRKTALATALCAAALSHGGWAQVAPPLALMEIETANQVQYVEDISDVSKFANDPSMTIACYGSSGRPECANQRLTFHAFLVLADIVAVNGQAVKGTAVIRGRRIQATPTPNPGMAIADVARQTIQDMTYEILTVDGRAIGTIMFLGLGLGSSPPGAPPFTPGGNYTIVGGTGAFLGVRGQATGHVDQNVRLASIAEDPASRHKNGGGAAGLVLQLIPMTRPEIVTTPTGPAVTHSSDFTLVAASKPAAAGEILSLFATGLGPTVPAVDPGQPFPSNPLAAVNSPVDVSVNGKSAEVLAAVGFPGVVDGYQVNFRVPADAAKGMATIQVSAAWITGPPVNVPIQ